MSHLAGTCRHGACIDCLDCVVHLDGITEDNAVDIIAAVEMDGVVVVYYNNGGGSSWTSAVIASCARCYFVQPCESVH